MQKFIQNTGQATGVKVVVEQLKRSLINNKAAKLSQHFNSYLTPVFAHGEHTRDVCHDIRHQVYCDEMDFLPPHQDSLERDAMDAHSLHCLVQHRASQKYAGTVRIVYSTSAQQLLPIEEHCADCLAKCEVKPSDFPRDKVGEVSRLAVPAEFRRRSSDNYEGAGCGNINQSTYSDKELRCFPLIAVGLYLAAANICRQHNIEHVFAMMEPRLASNLTYLGFSFRQIGPTFNYHGERAPFYGTVSEFVDTLPKGFRKLYQHLEDDLAPQFSAPKADVS
ncbi:MAG: N-acyl amino acid synthase of PEP-CTERM/exosortase system [Flavobacteriales bacterium]|jgi:N-acyl amino acid synthase of PEP-CTERM/exosortase system